MSLFSQSGGLVYHARARRYAGSLWQPFRAALAPWLAERELPTQKLILVGPSAAYCIDDAFLRRFREVLVLEPDPIAAWLLGRRLAELGVERVTRRADDLLVAPLLDGGPGLAALLEQEPHAAVAFCNVLGQLRFSLSEPAFERWLDAFRRRIAPRLGGRHWLSFHDRVSGKLAPELSNSERAPRALADDELVGRFYAQAPRGPRPIELVDHHTARIWTEPLPRSYFGWQLAPGRHHLIEGIACS